MNEEELRAIADEIEDRAKKARMALYGRLGRQWAYFLFGVICGGAAAAFLKLAF